VAVDDGSGFFLIDAERGTETVLRSESDLQAALSEARASPVSLIRPGEYYDQHRWGRGDAVAAGLMLGPPLLAMCFFLFRLLRVARSLPSFGIERSS
jgi:hypothetical protein